MKLNDRMANVEASLDDLQSGMEPLSEPRMPFRSTRRSSTGVSVHRYSVPSCDTSRTCCHVRVINEPRCKNCGPPSVDCVSS